MVVEVILVDNGGGGVCWLIVMMEVMLVDNGGGGMLVDGDSGGYVGLWWWCGFCWLIMMVGVMLGYGGGVGFVGW